MDDEDVEECQERVSRETTRDDSGTFDATLGKWGPHSVVRRSRHPLRKGSSSRRSSACGERLGRMTALQKPDGGVWGIVVVDVFRRLVGRTLAKQFVEQGQAATHPFQCALSTRAGTECVAHVVQALTSLDPSATILSIDGVGAYDSISRRAMFRGLMDMVDGEKLVPFVRLFYDSPSMYIWEE